MTRTVELAPKLASVRTARVFTAGVLGDDGVEASVIELSILLVSELAVDPKDVRQPGPPWRLKVLEAISPKEGTGADPR
jgi:hypothetical protein